MSRPLARRTRRRAGGFTLLELVLAAAISAALAVSLYTAMSVAFRARSSAANQTQAMREATIVLDIVQQDLESLPAPGGLLTGPFIGTTTGSLGAEAASLEFHGFGRDEAAEDDDPLADGLRRIVIELRTDVQPASLVRRVQPNLLAQVQEEPADEVLATNVRAFAVRFYDGSGWYTEWDSTTQGDVLPLAVELTITFDLPSPVDPARPYRVTQVIPVSAGREPQSETEEATTGA